MNRDRISSDFAELRMVGVLFCCFTSVLVADFARARTPPHSPACNAPYLRIIGAVLSDASLRDYGGPNLPDGKVVQVIWEDAPSASPRCKAGKLFFTVARSSALPRGAGKHAVVLTKLFHDDVAAYAEVWFSPSGKVGDLFMRNEGQWKVVQHSYYETSTIYDLIGR